MYLLLLNRNINGPHITVELLAHNYIKDARAIKNIGLLFFVQILFLLTHLPTKDNSTAPEVSKKYNVA